MSKKIKTNLVRRKIKFQLQLRENVNAAVPKKGESDISYRKSSSGASIIQALMMKVDNTKNTL
jgi:hypothetical protein